MIVKAKTDMSLFFCQTIEWQQIAPFGFIEVKALLSFRLPEVWWCSSQKKRHPKVNKETNIFKPPLRRSFLSSQKVPQHILNCILEYNLFFIKYNQVSVCSVRLQNNFLFLTNWLYVENNRWLEGEERTWKDWGHCWVYSNDCSCLYIWRAEQPTSPD